MMHEANAIAVDVLTEDGRWEPHKLGDDITRAVRAALEGRGETGEVSVLLGDDAAQRALNAAHRGIDRSTDVLSFPAHPGARALALREGAGAPLGDISLAYETVERDAAGEGVALRDHVMHLVVHAALHLLGETHDAPADATRMESAETQVLARLGIADPYA